MSGAGRSQAADNLEDLGWFVIDNLPPALMPKVSELAQAPGSGYERVGLVVGSGGDLAEIGPALDELRGSGAGVRIVFLDASTPTLVRRYGESKRRHPLAAQAGTVAGAIDLEREVLAEVRQAADIVIDTSELNVHDLRSRVNDLFAESDGSRMQVTLQSFGFKHGVPADVDTVFDCRFLPNPYWIDELRDLTGLDPAVQDYVRSMGLTGEFLRRIEDLFDLLLPAYVAEGKSLLTIGFGCTGGHHRSVTIVETVAEWLRSKGIEPRVRHRDISR